MFTGYCLEQLSGWEFSQRHKMKKPTWGNTEQIATAFGTEHDYAGLVLSSS